MPRGTGSFTSDTRPLLAPPRSKEWYRVRSSQVCRGFATDARVDRAGVRVAARRHGRRDLLRRHRAQDRHPVPSHQLQELEWHIPAALFSLWCASGDTSPAHPGHSFPRSCVPAQSLDRAGRSGLGCVLRARRYPSLYFRRVVPARSPSVYSTVGLRYRGSSASTLPALDGGARHPEPSLPGDRLLFGDLPETRFTCRSVTRAGSLAR